MYMRARERERERGDAAYPNARRLRKREIPSGSMCTAEPPACIGERERQSSEVMHEREREREIERETPRE